MIRLDDAACRHLDPALFHPAPHDNRTLKAAREVCVGCPIRLDCLALALTIPDVKASGADSPNPNVPTTAPTNLHNFVPAA